MIIFSGNKAHPTGSANQKCVRINSAARWLRADAVSNDYSNTSRLRWNSHAACINWQAHVRRERPLNSIFNIQIQRRYESKSRSRIERERRRRRRRAVESVCTHTHTRRLGNCEHYHAPLDPSTLALSRGSIRRLQLTAGYGPRARARARGRWQIFRRLAQNISPTRPSFLSLCLSLSCLATFARATDFPPDGIASRGIHPRRDNFSKIIRPLRWRTTNHRINVR